MRLGLLPGSGGRSSSSSCPLLPSVLLLLLLTTMAMARASPSSTVAALANSLRRGRAAVRGDPWRPAPPCSMAPPRAGAGVPWASSAVLAFQFRPPMRQFRLTPRCERKGPVSIPQDRLEFSYSRSSGPGGQNVNKLNTRVELRFHVESADWIPEGMRGRFAAQQRHRINKAGEIVISSQEHRTQLKNREDCLGKLEEALARAAIVPKERNMRTGLTEWEKENRLREKKKRSETKSARRQKGRGDDW